MSRNNMTRDELVKFIKNESPNEIIVQNQSFVHEKLGFLDLSNIEFINCEFNNCSFTHCDLSHAVFKKSKISFCGFNFANCSSVNFINTEVCGVSFYHANLMYSEFKKSDLMGDIYIKNAAIGYSDFENIDKSKLISENPLMLYD